METSPRVRGGVGEEGDMREDLGKRLDILRKPKKAMRNRGAKR